MKMMRLQEEPVEVDIVDVDITTTDIKTARKECIIAALKITARYILFTIKLSSRVNFSFCV